MLYARSSVGRGLPAARVDLRERVENGGRANTQSQVARDLAQQVARLQRCGLVEHPCQQVELAALRAGALGLRDRVQRVDHDGDVEAGPTVGVVCREQLFRGFTEIAGFLHVGQNLLGGRVRGGGHRTDREFLRQAEVDSRELRRDQALAQVADAGEQLRRGVG